MSLSILLFKGFLLFEILIFWVKNAPIPLCLSKDKIEKQSSKNTILTPTKTLPKKYIHSLVEFFFFLEGEDFNHSLICKESWYKASTTGCSIFNPIHIIK